MNHTTGSFQSADGTKIYTESWLPDGAPKAGVIIVHGFGEHIGRYSHVAPHLVNVGYAVYGLDHLGHGKSGGDPRAYFPNFDQPLNDLKQYLDTIKATQPGKKIFLYGHSLGSLIALAFALKYQSELAGLVLSANPLAIETVQPAALVAAASILNKFAPKLAITPPVPSTTLSRDKAVSRAYDTDPLVEHGKVRVRMGYQILSVSRDVKAHLGDLKLPLFIFHGADDKLTPPISSQILYDGAGSSDKKLKFYDGLRHETHNEPEQGMVIDNIINWLNAH